VYFDNLAWDGRELREVEKPFPKRDFSTFEAYRAFLDASVRQMELLARDVLPAVRERARVGNAAPT